MDQCGPARHKKAPFPGLWGVSVDLAGSPEPLDWWRRRELNPRPLVLQPDFYMLSSLFVFRLNDPKSRVLETRLVRFHVTAFSQHSKARLCILPMLQTIDNSCIG